MKTKDIRDPDLKGIDHRKLPTGSVVSSPVKGDFLAVPLFGWVAQRADEEKTPLVMLAVLLIRSIENPTPRGTLMIELPVMPETELATLATLERFGWDGRVWPVDDGWPTGSEVDEGNILALMEQASLRATMTFPSDRAGAQTVSVQRAKGPFLMPPLPEPEGDVDPVKLEKLRTLCANPRIFFNPLKPAISED